MERDVTELRIPAAEGPLGERFRREVGDVVERARAEVQNGHDVSITRSAPKNLDDAIVHRALDAAIEAMFALGEARRGQIRVRETS